MLNTLGIIAAGTLMMFNTTSTEITSTEIPTIQTELVTELAGDEVKKEMVSFAITVDASEEKLEEIKAAAEEAGMGFTYKVRGVAKKKLVIDMVIDYGEDYTLNRVVITEADGLQTIEWEVDEEGKALSFIDETDGDSITQNR